MEALRNFDLQSPETIDNPFPMYAWLREHQPVFYRVRGLKGIGSALRIHKTMASQLKDLRAEKNHKIAIKPVDGYVLAFNLETGELFSLNETAAEILNLCVKPIQVGQIYDTLASRHKKKQRGLEKSITDILERFVKSRLINLNF